MIIWTFIFNSLKWKGLIKIKMYGNYTTYEGNTFLGSPGILIALALGTHKCLIRHCLVLTINYYNTLLYICIGVQYFTPTVVTHDWSTTSGKIIEYDHYNICKRVRHDDWKVMYLSSNKEQYMDIRDCKVICKFYNISVVSLYYLFNWIIFLNYLYLIYYYTEHNRGWGPADV